MATRSNPLLEHQLLSTFDALVPDKHVPLLLLGNASEELETRLRSRASSLTRAPNMESVPAGAEFDAALVVGRLEHERWDRWELQQLHARLRPEATLILAVPNLANFWSPSGLAFLGGRVVREMRIRLARRTALPVAESGPFRGRRYRISSLRAMLEELGFEALSCATVGNALYRAAAQLSPQLARQTSGDLVLGTRRKPSLWTDDGGRPFPERDSYRLDFESTHAPNVGIREAWASKHEKLAGTSAADLDAAVYANSAVLVLAPHPDDEIIGCGGTLRRLLDAGARVTLLHATDGSDSAALTETPEHIRTKVRVEEAARVVELLGIQETVYWNADNRNFRVTPERVDALAELLGRVSPRAVFAPFVTDIHPDHFAVSRMLAAALPKSGLDLASVEVFGYEVWSLVPANVICDVTELMPLIERLLLTYETALKVDDYVHLCARRMFYNACRYRNQNGYADAFLALPASDFLGVVQEQERAPIRPD